MRLSPTLYNSQGLNKIYILAARQPAVCAPFLCQVAREFWMVTFIIASKLWFPTTFLEPNHPHHSVAVGFYRHDSRVFSKTWLQHSTKKSCTTFRFLHVVLLLTQAFTK
jgi:hypothetical protein